MSRLVMGTRPRMIRISDREAMPPPPGAMNTPPVPPIDGVKTGFSVESPGNVRLSAPVRLPRVPHPGAGPPQLVRLVGPPALQHRPREQHGEPGQQRCGDDERTRRLI